MNKHKWEQAWEDKTFEIKTLIPSILVSKYTKDLKSEDHVLDVGCGNARNSIFLVKQGCNVECFDVMDLEWIEKLPTALQNKIQFQKSNVLEYSYNVSHYKAIIVTRVIQYLNSEELSFLFQKIHKGLKPDGFLLLSYTMEGGIFNKKEIDVPTHVHPIESVERTLKKIFKKVIIAEGGKTSRHVNYSSEVLTYDIYASDPYNLDYSMNSFR